MEKAEGSESAEINRLGVADERAAQERSREHGARTEADSEQVKNNPFFCLSYENFRNRQLNGSITQSLNSRVPGGPSE